MMATAPSAPMISTFGMVPSPTPDATGAYS
jgi:hypothetical protein